jgi:diphthamide biosynthesis methyltransferase
MRRATVCVDAGMAGEAVALAAAGASVIAAAHAAAAQARWRGREVKLMPIVSQAAGAVSRAGGEDGRMMERCRHRNRPP